MIRITDCPYLTSPVYQNYHGRKQQINQIIPAASIKRYERAKGFIVLITHMQKEHKTIIRVHKGCISYIFKKINNIYHDIFFRYIDKPNHQSMTALIDTGRKPIKLAHLKAQVS